MVPDSLDADKTFDVDSAVRSAGAVSQLTQRRNDFLPPDEDAVFLDTQGMLRSELDNRCLCGRLPVCLFVCLYVCMFVCLHVCISVCL